MTDETRVVVEYVTALCAAVAPADRWLRDAAAAGPGVADWLEAGRKAATPAVALRFQAHQDLARGGLARFRCAACGSAVDDFLCNSAVCAARPEESKGADWFVACSNVACPHAVGEGYGPEGSPSWAE